MRLSSPNIFSADRIVIVSKMMMVFIEDVMTDISPCLYLTWLFQPVTHNPWLFSFSPLSPCFSLGGIDGFCLTFLFVSSISFWWFLKVWSQTFIPVSAHVFLICFDVHFLFSTQYCFKISILMFFYVLLGLPVCFLYIAFLFCLYLVQILDTAEWEQSTSLVPFCDELPS